MTGCDLCDAPAFARVTDDRQAARDLCRACLSNVGAAGTVRTGSRNRILADAARFFLALAPPRTTSSHLPVTSLPAGTTCDGCGLRFDEFYDFGQAGCERCYAAFREAILPALSILHER